MKEVGSKKNLTDKEHQRKLTCNAILTSKRLFFSEGNKPQHQIKEDNKKQVAVTPGGSHGSHWSPRKPLKPSSVRSPEKIHSRSHLINIMTFNNVWTEQEYQPLGMFLQKSKSNYWHERTKLYIILVTLSNVKWMWLTITACILGSIYSSLSFPYMGPFCTLGEESDEGLLNILD